MIASGTPPTGDIVCNPGICPDWELNHQPFGSQAGDQSTELQQPGQKVNPIILTKVQKSKFKNKSGTILLSLRTLRESGLGITGTVTY